MANFSAAFGYDFYIVPLDSSSVDVSFTGVTTADDPINGFIDTTTLASGAVTFSDGVFTVGGTVFAMDGTDDPVRLAGLTSASLETDTGSEDIYTYDDDTRGFNQSVATTKSFSISLAGVADFSDVGYQILRVTEQNTVADSLRVKLVRVGPTGTTEAIYGYGTLTGYTESNEVTSIVSWECTITGYGPYQLELEASSGNSAPATGSIGFTGSFITTTPFTETSSSTVATTFSAPAGGGTTAQGTVDTNGVGTVQGISLTDTGSGYAVGEIVTGTEDAGSGVFTFEVTTVV